MQILGLNYYIGRIDADFEWSSVHGILRELVNAKESITTMRHCTASTSNNEKHATMHSDPMNKKEIQTKPLLIAS